MLTDLADLTPPLVVGIGIIVVVVLVLRRQMAPKRHEDTEHQSDDPQ